jgi:hypothetical protein
MYGKGGTVEATGRYHQPAGACAAHQSAAYESAAAKIL